jgi:hypothetical protein
MKKIFGLLLILAGCTPIHLVIDDPTPQISNRAIGWQTQRAKMDFRDSTNFKKLTEFEDGARIGNYKIGSRVTNLDSIVDNGTDIYFYKGATILTAVPGISGAAWGTISGSLPNQTDLNTALGLKANLVSPTLTGSPIVPGYVPTSTTVNSHPLNANVTVTASDIGLGNVDNTSDANKPISTLTQSALNAKQATLVSGTNIKTVGGTSLLGSGDIAVGGTGTVTNVSVTSANGVSGSVATSTTTPAITLTLGAITPSSVGAVGTVTGSNLSGTNTGDNATNTQYSGLVSNATHTGDATGSTALTVVKINGILLSGLASGILKNTTGTGVPSIASAGTDYVIPAGNVATATKLAATKTINGIAFDGSANITVPSNIAPGTTGNVMESNGSVWTSGSAKLPVTDTTAMLLKYLRKNGVDSLGWVDGKIAAFRNGDTIDFYQQFSGRMDLFAAMDTDNVIETDYRSDLIRDDLADYEIGLAAADSANGGGASGTYVTGKDHKTDIALKANIDNPTFTTGAAGVTQTVGTNSTQLATTAFVFNNTDLALKTYQAMGSTIKAMNVGLNISNVAAGTQTLTDNRAHYVVVYLSTPQTITGVKLWQVAQGDYTADNFNGVALYSVSGGTLTQRAVSINDGNIWKATAESMITKAFAASYAAPAGLYYIALVYNSSAQTTAPTLGGVASRTNLMAWDFTNNLFLSGTKTSTNTLPTPTIESNTISVYSNIPFVALY